MLNFKDHIISSKASLKDALQQLNDLSGANHTVLFCCDESEQLIGTITDGDIRRAFLKGLTLENSLENVANRDFASLTRETISTEYIRHLRSINKKLVPLLDSKGRIKSVYDFNQRKTILPIDAVLMAGGRGERLRPLTDKTPKPLLMVGDKPIIDYNVDSLIKHGVEDFFVTVNYLADQLVDHFNKASKEKKINAVCIKEDKPLGTMGSLTLIDNFKNDVVLVMNSDLFTNIDYEDFYEDFIRNNADMSVATIPYNVDIPYAIMNLEGDSVLSFQEKPTYTYYANAGIYLIKKELLNIIPEDSKYDATDFMDDLIEKNKCIIRYPIVGYWVDIGKPQDFNKVQEFAKHINS